jgi:hypothetical protein
MARETMTQLIERVRTLTGLAADLYSDDTVQQALDNTAVDSGLLALSSTATVGSDYTFFVAPVGNFETATLYTSSKVVVEDEATANLIAGTWRFAEARTDAALYVAGTYYSPEAAGAELLEAAANAAALEFDFSADGASYSRSQKAAAYRAAAKALRRQGGVSVGTILRNDESWK